MERQRSFTVKSTSFWALSLAISSSLVFFTFFSLWALRSSPLVSPQPTLRFTTPIAPSLSPAGDILLEAPVFIETHFTELENTTGTSGSSATGVAAIRMDQDQDQGQVLLGHSKSNYTVPQVEKLIAPSHSSSGNFSSKVPILIGTHIAKDGNSSRSWGSSAAGVALRRDQVLGHSKRNQTGPNMEKSSDGSKASNVKNGEDIDGIRRAGCDLGRGRWVYDKSYPLYTNWSCPFIDEGFNCGGNGRPDVGYMKWRWQPQDCQVPRLKWGIL